MNRLRIVITSSHALPHLGGVEVVVDREIRALAELGHEVTLITSCEGGEGETPQYPSNVRVIRIASSGVLKRKFGLFMPLFSPKLLSALFREISRCDVVHSHGWIAPSTVAALLIGRMLGKRCMLTEHNGIQPRKTKVATVISRLAMESLGRLSVRLAHRCVAINSRIQGHLRRYAGPRTPIDFIPFPVDKQRFHPPTPSARQQARAQLGWNDDRKKVLFVGRLVEEKGIPLLLGAVDPAYDLVFCGAGDVGILGPLPRSGVEYLPPRKQAELVSVYHAADLFVLPSNIEGFPLVAREALACGLKAVLAYDPGYEPYRVLPNLSFCKRTPEGIRLAIHAALAQPLASSEGNPFDFTPSQWVNLIYQFERGC